MPGLFEAASAILSASERQLEVVSRNVANVSTSGFKRQISSARSVAATGRGAFDALVTRTRSDLASGKLRETGNPLDLAIAGSGFFQLRDGDRLVYSRQGSFRLAADGTVVSPQGLALQQAGGGDLVLDTETVRIAADGTVLDADRPVARIAVFTSSKAGAIESVDGSLFRLPPANAVEIDVPQVRQGMIEASNVSMGDEMVTMMTALRQAETGSRLVQTYDDLLGRAITAFGQSGR